jgi:hypothetical protein
MFSRIKTNPILLTHIDENKKQIFPVRIPTWAFSYLFASLLTACENCQPCIRQDVQVSYVQSQVIVDQACERIRQDPSAHFGNLLVETLLMVTAPSAFTFRSLMRRRWKGEMRTPGCPARKLKPPSFFRVLASLCQMESVCTGRPCICHCCTSRLVARAVAEILAAAPMV